jgi:hypothetical protein
MAQNSGQTQAFKPSRFWYPEGEAPFGELNLVRIDHRADLNTNRPYNAWLLAHAPSVVIDAWIGSDWLKADIQRSGKVIKDIKAELDETIASNLTRFIVSAAHNPSRKSAWFALEPPERPELSPSALHGLATYLSESQLVGVATAKHDISGTLLQRGWKRLQHPEKVYAKVGDIDIAQSAQDKGIGTALHLADLGLFGDEQHPTTYVSTSNHRLITHLEDLGYKVTGSRLRTDILEGVDILEARLEAVSKREVEGNLIASADWVTKAKVIHDPVERF